MWWIPPKHFNLTLRRHFDEECDSDDFTVLMQLVIVMRMVSIDKSQLDSLFLRAILMMTTTAFPMNAMQSCSNGFGGYGYVYENP